MTQVERNEPTWPTLGSHSRNARILKALQSGEESASNLARVCDCPTASVRRSIQELRAQGHNISHSDIGEQIYRMPVEPRPNDSDCHGEFYNSAN